MALSTGLTRRLKNNFQAGVTHTLMFYMHDDGSFGFSKWNGGQPVQSARRRVGALDRASSATPYRLWGMYQPHGDCRSAVSISTGSGNYYASSISGTPFGKPGTNRLNTRTTAIVIPEAARDQFEGPDAIEPNTVGTAQRPPRHAASTKWTCAFSRKSEGSGARHAFS